MPILFYLSPSVPVDFEEVRWGWKKAVPSCCENKAEDSEFLGKIRGSLKKGVDWLERN